MRVRDELWKPCGAIDERLFKANSAVTFAVGGLEERGLVGYFSLASETDIAYTTKKKW